MNIDEIIKHLGMIPLEEEGGYYSETYRSDKNNKKALYNGGIRTTRSIQSCIYYLMTEDSFSALHRLPSDEIWHFYLGDPIEQLQLLPDGTGKIIEIGNNLPAGQQPQVIVPQNVWQGSKLKAGGKFALVGTTMAPGFEFEDYEAGNRDELILQYPEFSFLIGQLANS